MLTKRALIGITLLGCAVFSLPASAQEVLTDPPEDALIQESYEHFIAGDMDASLKSANEALALNPSSAIAYNNICSAHIQLGAYLEAIAACRKALEISPVYRRAYHNLRGAYEGAAKLSPTVDVYLGLSECSYWDEDMDASIEASRQVIALDPDNAVAYNNLCAAHAFRGEWDPAIEACNKALVLDPDLERARNNLNWAQSGKDGD